MVLKVWAGFFLVSLNLIFFLDLLPKMINANSTELVLLVPIVTMIVLTADYYGIKDLRK